MRTTIEIPDPLFRRAKMNAVEHHLTFKELVAEALEKYLAVPAKTEASKQDPPWMKLAGMISKKDADEMQRFIADADFSKVNAEDWK